MAMFAKGSTMPKRLVFCFDGTWNTLSAKVPTNVAKLAQMICPVASDGTVQIVYYDEGIGTNTNWLGKQLQGMTGRGLTVNLREAYRFLIFNYEPGDQIFAFGFSRGAFTARSFAGFIRHAGILDVISAPQIETALELYKRAPAGKTGLESAQAMRFRLRHCRGVCVSDLDRRFRVRSDPGGGHDSTPLLDIRYVGVWDTVAVLGLPAFVPFAGWFNRRYRFHDAVLTSKIKSARHAVAIDELRPTFRATLFGRRRINDLNQLAQAARAAPFESWERPYQELWFPGVHGAVGGGGARRGLSDGALAWVLSGAKKQGLRLRNTNDAQTFQLDPDATDSLQNVASKHLFGMGLFGWLRRAFHSPRSGPTHIDELALPTLQRWFARAVDLPEKRPYRPGALAPLAAKIDKWPYRNAPEFKSEYVVLRGETLSSIAKAALGDAARYHEIFAANRDRLDDPDSLLPGMRLRITRD